MDYRRFSINLKEAGGLDCKELFLKRPIYAMVSVVGSSSSKKRTSAGTYIGHVPTWGSRSSMRFYVEDFKLQCNQLVLMVQILRKRVLGSDKVIGEVCVPLKELYDSCGGVCSTNYSFHQVARPSEVGKRPGYLCFTYEFGDMIRGADRNFMAYPLGRWSHSRVTPSAPCLDWLGF